ncbi:MAG: DMT family transporter [Chloroflexi bacterium]|nr:DMT family transporter [Chloroflexota bacterium]
MTPRASATLLILGGVWGASFLFIKVVVEETSPMELVAGRLLFGALAIGLVMVLRRTPLPRRPSLLGKVCLMALMSNVVPFLLIAWAEVHIASGTASVLNSTMPLFTALFAAAFLAEEHFTAARLAGLMAGFLGVVVLAGSDVVHITDSDVLGQMAVVAAAACYGFGAVFARTLLRSEEPLTLSGLQLLAGTVMAMPLLLALEGAPDYSLSLEAWLSLVTLGVVGSGLAYVAYLWLVDHVGSVRTSLVTYVIPVVGLLLGWAVLDEQIGINTGAGAALIILGVAAVMRGQLPAPHRAPASTAVAAD